MNSETETETLNRDKTAASDCNAFAGTWPFRFLGESARPANVEQALREAGITSAWISPLDGLFNAEPYTANDWLFRETAESPLLQPVPILNPSLTGAADELASLCERHRNLPALRLTPGYHGYDPEGPESHRFIERTPKEKVILITLRVQDKRAQPPLFQVPDVTLDSVFTIAETFPEHTFLLCGIRLGEVTSAKEKWHQQPNLHIETSFLDGISGIGDAAELVGDAHLHLGTLAPLHYPSASVEQIKASGPPGDRIHKILTNTPKERVD